MAPLRTASASPGGFERRLSFVDGCRRLVNLEGSGVEESVGSARSMPSAVSGVMATHRAIAATVPLHLSLGILAAVGMRKHSRAAMAKIGEAARMLPPWSVAMPGDTVGGADADHGRLHAHSDNF